MTSMDSEFFEEGVGVVMDHRMATMDFATADTDTEIDEAMDRIRSTGAEVRLLGLVVPQPVYMEMTDEACTRLRGLFDKIGGIND